MREEIYFIIEKLALLKAIEISERQESAIIAELLKCKFTHEDLLNSYDEIKMKKSYNKFSIEDFLNESYKERIKWAEL